MLVLFLLQSRCWWRVKYEMWCGANASWFALSHTVSYKVLSPPLAAIFFTILEAWCNSLLRKPCSSSIRQKEDDSLFAPTAISFTLLQFFFNFSFTCPLDIWPGTVQRFRNFTLPSKQHEWAVKYFMPNPHHSIHTLLTEPQLIDYEETQASSWISIFLDRPEVC